MRLLVPLALLLALTPATAHPPDPSLCPFGDVVFVEPFDFDNAGVPADSFADFARWRVDAGRVDLTPARTEVDVKPPHGLAARLDGTLVTREPLTLGPGHVQLTFQLASPALPHAPRLVEVTLGTLHRETVVVPPHGPFTPVTRTFLLDQPVEARLAFAAHGAPGPLLDEVRLCAQTL